MPTFDFPPFTAFPDKQMLISRRSITAVIKPLVFHHHHRRRLCSTTTPNDTPSCCAPSSFATLQSPNPPPPPTRFDHDPARCLQHRQSTQNQLKVPHPFLSTLPPYSDSRLSSSRPPTTFHFDHIASRHTACCAHFGQPQPNLSVTLTPYRRSFRLPPVNPCVLHRYQQFNVVSQFMAGTFRFLKVIKNGSLNQIEFLSSCATRSSWSLIPHSHNLIPQIFLGVAPESRDDLTEPISPLSRNNPDAVSKKNSRPKTRIVSVIGIALQGASCMHPPNYQHPSAQLMYTVIGDQPTLTLALMTLFTSQHSSSAPNAERLSAQGLYRPQQHIHPLATDQALLSTLTLQLEQNEKIGRMATLTRYARLSLSVNLNYLTLAQPLGASVTFTYPPLEHANHPASVNTAKLRPHSLSAPPRIPPLLLPACNHLFRLNPVLPPASISRSRSPSDTPSQPPSALKSPFAGVNDRVSV
ncbi:hypothetical protein R3P38DRAFT_2804645 [Favolaschia claudopus]|uniref:Uncharacterized protein n=1 Tax=Favolaschia claudopus TaxID=2862362 RepID=A0AAV9ZPE5_9AGAR